MEKAVAKEKLERKKEESLYKADQCYQRRELG